MGLEAQKPQWNVSLRKLSIVFFVKLPPVYRQAGKAGLAGHVPVKTDGQISDAPKTSVQDQAPHLLYFSISCNSPILL